MPHRIQRQRTAGWRLPEGAVYVGRPGKWGNPFKLGEDVARDSDLWPYIISLYPGADNPIFGGAVRFKSVRICRAEDVVEAHFQWFLEQPALMLTVAEELGGRDLCCWCGPGEPCHADTLLLAAADWPLPEDKDLSAACRAVTGDEARRLITAAAADLRRSE